MTTAPPSGDRGATLVELIVVTMLLGVVGAITMAGIVSGLHSTSHSQSRGEALTDVQRTVEQVSRELRGADPMCSLAPREAELIVRRGRETDTGTARWWRYHYEVVEQDDERWGLRERRWEVTGEIDAVADSSAGCGAAPGPARERPLVRDLTDSDVFWAFRRDGTALEGDADDNAARAWRLRLAVSRWVEADRPPLSVETTVTIRNR